jgi:hypothetical protein
MAGIDTTRWQVSGPLLDELLEADPDEGSALDFPGSSALPEKVVDNYTLERPPGQDGMGNVWLASPRHRRVMDHAA